METAVTRDILKRLLESRGIVPEDSAGAAECARLLEECEDRPALLSASLGRILRPAARGSLGTK